jgi:EAL domain-containing protein (putative c-di-GMP-specific phosphodiesterase class I)/FixJ family two-component response regulator
MRIVLVDDQPLILAILREQLEAVDGHRVVEFTSGSEALAYLSRCEPAADVVFCDLNMPRMDGVQFMRHLAQLGYQGGLVLISVEDRRILDSAERVARAHDLRVLGTLQKPLRSEEVRGVLTAAPVAAPAVRPRRVEPAELSMALQRDELVNYYQPKVHLADGALAGVECLVRWQHPAYGLICPDAFIGLAEQHGMIEALTDRVIQGALRQMRDWAATGLETEVAVNVSMDNLVQLDFIDRLTHSALAAGMPLSAITLEVTESRLMSNRLAALEVLTRLRLRRVSLYIDDFGTGHSSLAQLRDIPFTGLKIDRDFVHGAWRDAALGAIVGASMELAKNLGMRTVAEGIEDRQDWTFLRES